MHVCPYVVCFVLLTSVSIGDLTYTPYYARVLLYQIHMYVRPCIKAARVKSKKHAFNFSCQCKTCHIQLTMHIFPQQEEAATGRSLMQQPRYGHCGADALPAESKPALVFPTFVCV